MFARLTFYSSRIFTVAPALVCRGLAGLGLAGLGLAGLGAGPVQAQGPLPELYIEPVVVPEGDTFSMLNVKVKMLNGPSVAAVSAEYVTIDIDAEASFDYQTVGGLLTFNPGSVEEIIQVPILGDFDFEQDEAFYFKIFNPTNADIPQEKEVIVLLNDDVGAGTFNIGDAQTIEGDDGLATLTFTVELDIPPGAPTTPPSNVFVAWETRPATAQPGTDYVSAEGKLFFGPGDTFETLDIQVRGDLEVETDELFFVDLVYSEGGPIGRATGVGAILNDDEEEAPLATLSAEDLSIPEGDEGPNEGMVLLRLSQAADKAIEVNFKTEADDAEAGVDFQLTEGMVVFAPGETERVVTVTVLGDTVEEEDETFRLVLDSPVGAELEKAEAIVTIVDDDAVTGEAPRLTIEDVAVDEGDEGVTLATFEVRLIGTPLSDEPITVSYRTADLSATVSDGDYLPTGGVLTFDAGTAEQTFDVQVLGDTVFEPDERFGVTLEGPSGAVLDRSGASGYIRNDDADDGGGGGGGAGGGGGGGGGTGGNPSVLRIAGVDAAMEGDGPARVRVERLGDVSGPAQVTLATAAGTAQPGQDFVATNVRLQWAPGEGGIQEVTIPIVDDSVVEVLERFGVGLGAPANAQLGNPDRAVITVTDDDVPMQLEAVGEVERTATAETELVLEVKVSTEDGRPVAGVPVQWATEGRAALAGEPRVISDGDGLARNTVRLARVPGLGVVVARLPGTDKAVTFRIRVEGNLSGTGPPGGGGSGETVADTLNRNCADSESGDYSELCEFLFGLPDGERAEALDRLTPRGALARGRAGLRGPGQQLRNVGARLNALRGGMARQSIDQLAFLIQGDPLSLGPIQHAMRQDSHAEWAAAKVSKGFKEGLESPYNFLDDDLDGDSVDGGAGSPAAGSPAATDSAEAAYGGESPWGFFANGRISIGEAPRLGDQAGYDLTTQGLSAGVDYRLGSNFVVGAALGYVRSETEVEQDAGSFELDGTSLSLYLTWFSDAFYVDGVLSYGQQSYDIERVVNLPRPFGDVSRFVAVGQPDSDQVAAHLGVGYDFRLGQALNLSGFLRGNWVRSTIDSYTERGAFFLDLAYEEQESESLLGEAGIELTYPVSLSWGVLQPMLRLAYLREFEDGNQSLRARFAVDPTARVFTLESETPDRSFLNLALGVTVTLPRSWASYLQYDTDLERDDLDIYTLSGGFRFQF